MLARTHASDPAHVVETTEEDLLVFLKAHSSVRLRSRSFWGEMIGP